MRYWSFCRKVRTVKKERNTSRPKIPADITFQKVEGIHSLTNHPPFKNQAFMKALADAENDQKVGYDLTYGWFPHTSIEGGTKTIGYGHKLSRTEQDTGFIKIGGAPHHFNESLRIGIPDDKINELFREDVERAWSIARNQWNTHLGIKKGFDELSSAYQAVLTDLVYNIGTLVSNGRWGWPKLATAMLDQDNQQVREEMLRYYTPAGTKKKIPLFERRDLIANAVGI